MSIERITVTLPESICRRRRLQRAAQLTFHSVDEVITKMVNLTLKSPPDLPPDLADELAAMALFTDEALWAAAESSLSPAHQRRLSQLIEASKEGNLIAAQSAELEHLLELYDRAVLRRAHVLAILSQRGYQISERTEWQDSDYDNEDS